ncbi:hypothetical protein DSM01_2222 [Leeuwenhoekiella palythoae]|uniref:Uncharacterized protein n=1 Tax=Leeuwenhoekiella palythoae TaxID=573501 RepID=A0ABY0D394_9FLAO|nr:hypothetical protein DSM01_2222 [Leeuwenhoekiella palythoae]
MNYTKKLVNTFIVSSFGKLTLSQNFTFGRINFRLCGC